MNLRVKEVRIKECKLHVFIYMSFKNRHSSIYSNRRKNSGSLGKGVIICRKHNRDFWGARNILCPDMVVIQMCPLWG